MKFLKTIFYAHKNVLLILGGYSLTMLIMFIFPRFFFITLLMIFSILLICIIIYHSVKAGKKWKILSNGGLSLNQALSNGLVTPEMYYNYFDSHTFYYVFGKKYYLVLEGRTRELVFRTLHDLCELTGEDYYNKYESQSEYKWDYMI